MPRRRPEKLTGLRVELNERERDALDLWSAGQATGSILNGVGAVLLPFAGAIQLLTALWIAEQGKDALANATQKILTSYRDSKTAVEKQVDLAQVRRAEARRDYMRDCMDSGGDSDKCKQLAMEKFPPQNREDTVEEALGRELSWWEKFIMSSKYNI